MINFIGNYMIHNSWIAAPYGDLYYRYLYSKANKKDISVLTIAGFGQPLCDWDYFMTKVANFLFSKKYNVLQVDPRGHGESTGYLESIEFADYLMDINTAIRFLKEDLVNKHIVGIGRGLSATVLANLWVEKTIEYFVGINPFYNYNQHLPKIIAKHNGNLNTLFDSYKLKTSTYYKRFFESLGSYIPNIKGQIINANFIERVVKYRLSNELYNDNFSTLFVQSSKIGGCYICKNHFERSLNKLFKEFNHQYFYSDAMCQSKIILEISDFISKIEEVSL